MDATGTSHKPIAGRAGLNLDRGLGWALLFGAIGFLAPIVLGLAFTVGRWAISRSDEFDRAYDIGWLPTYLAHPALGTAIVFAATGWAWRGAGGSYRFTPTLSIIFAVCIPTWALIFSLANLSDPPYLKDATTHKPLIEPRDVLFLALPAFTTASVLSLIRACRRPSATEKAPPDPELA